MYKLGEQIRGQTCCYAVQINAINEDWPASPHLAYVSQGCADYQLSG